ncbi:hypothetical protein [Sphingomonas sp.]|uniref:hypothetical protein n=2 Tax=unclassified Sphingomonas TaxID=196159 RepID=UPI0025F55C65|nr:hypothetical protein [Sphingomonas sp.]
MLVRHPHLGPLRMNGEINWGPEIRVDGKRPEWLGDGPQPMMVHNAVGWHTWRSCQVDPALVAWSFNTGRPNVDLIRLPADHPHYATLSRATAPNGAEVGPEVVERMIALVRRMGGNSSIGQPFYEFEAITHAAAHYDEARAIVALLPEPVDVDGVEAAKIAKGMIYGNDDSVSHDRIVRLLKDAIKRGRALEKEAGR